MRRHPRRALQILSVAALAGLLLSACASPSASSSAPTGDASVTAPSGLASSGTLTYGVAATFPPFEYKDGSDLAGFDIEMAQALASEMGLSVTPSDMDFDGLIPALNGKRIDIINSAMYIKPEREEQVDFVPYMLVGEAVMVPKGNPKGISNIPDDLSGLTVAVTRGAIGETYMTDFNTQLEADGKAPMTILTLPTNQDALLAVTSGRADAFDTSTPGAAYTQTEQPDTFEVAGTFDLGTEVGIAVRKGDTEMKTAVEAALKELVDSGDYESLIARFNLPAESNYFTSSK